MSRNSHAPGYHMHYVNFGIMIVLSYIAMYFAMFAMIDTFGDFYNNINMAYMAALMAAPMAIIELVLMRRMYPSRAVNLSIIGVSLVALVAAWSAIRLQGGVGDLQFVRSMVSHHSGAILMCRQADIRDAELRTLCEQITKGQREEITQMNAILKRLLDGR